MRGSTDSIARVAARRPAARPEDAPDNDEVLQPVAG